jgi:hypothetical protein
MVETVTLPPTLQHSIFPSSMPRHHPPKLRLFWEIVDSNRAPEESELSDVLEQMNYPSAVTIDMIAVAAGTGLHMDFASG